MADTEAELDLSENISWVTTRAGVLVVASIILSACLILGLFDPRPVAAVRL